MEEKKKINWLAILGGIIRVIATVLGVELIS